MPKETKATVAELESRNNDVMRLLCEGSTTKSIYEHGIENKWNVNKRQIDNYIAKCYEEIHKEIKANKKYILDSTIKKRYTLYEKAFIAQDYRLCKDILTDLNKLLGHFQHSDITINNNIELNQYNNITNDQSDDLRNKFIKLISSKRQA